MERHRVLDSDEDRFDVTPIRVKRTRRAPIVMVNDVAEMDSGEENDDMDGVDEDFQEFAAYESEEGSESERVEYHAYEGREEVDDSTLGQDTAGADVGIIDANSGKSAGSLGTEPSMLGTFTDPDVLDCPICFVALTIQVFQCENGHIACSCCCNKIGNKCPSCSLPIGYIRCRSIERILNSVKFSCQNLEYGCKMTMLHREREVHEKACIFAPCYCPVEGCSFAGSSKNLYAHFRGSHLRHAIQFDYKRPLKFWLETWSEKVILQEKTDGTIFVVNQSRNYGPPAINLIHIGASHSKEEFCYELSVECGDSTLKLKSVSATMRKWSASNRLKNYLLVPSDFAYPNDSLDVGLCIDKRRGW